jgi:hypothetical protein
MLLTNFNLLQILEKHQDDSRNFFPTEEIEDLGNLFDNRDGVVLEEFVSELMGTQNPEDDASVVCDLWLLEARSLKKIRDNLEALACAEFFSELVGLEEGHQSKGVSVVTQLERVDVSLLHHPVEELSGLLLAFFELFRSTKKR